MADTSQENQEINEVLGLTLDPGTALVLDQKIAIKYTTTEPTFASKRNGERRVYFDGTNYWLYVYANGAWRNMRFGATRYVLYRIVAPSVDATAGTTVGGDLEFPFTGTITEVGAYVDTAGTTNVSTIDINKNGTSILSTKVTIDSTEKTSRTAATAPVISTSAILAGDILTFDIDDVSLTNPKGLTIRIGVQ